MHLPCAWGAVALLWENGMKQYTLTGVIRDEGDEARGLVFGYNLPPEGEVLDLADTPDGSPVALGVIPGTLSWCLVVEL